MSRAWSRVAAAALLGLTLLGCTGESGGASQPSATVGTLKIDYDQNKAAKVGEELQLHLKFTGDPGQLMVGAMIKTESATAKWFSDPAGAVEFDSGNSRARFKQQGQVKIWATYTQKGEELKSNVLELDVKATDLDPALKKTG